MKLILILFILFSSPVYSANFEKVLVFDLHKEILDYKTYLEKPSYLLLYLGYKNMFISNFSEVQITNDDSFQIGFGKLDFVRRDRNNYYYDISIINTNLNGRIYISIDHNNLKANVFFDKEFLLLLPESILNRVNKKLVNFFSLSKQSYLSFSISSDLETFGSIENFLIINGTKGNNQNLEFTSNQKESFYLYYLITMWLILLFIMSYKKILPKKI